ncbi:hypothetical protein [Micromonospora sp. LOL_023]|uniref:hypothetical protein n=1 Tax=Micromonospora sp. LOL_023 TaxID=3345418 RepID=UPI003A8A84D0
MLKIATKVRSTSMKGAVVLAALTIALTQGTMASATPPVVSESAEPVPSGYESTAPSNTKEITAADIIRANPHGPGVVPA